jgi:nucleotide-binding universal stress UspA family protein
MSEQHRIVAGVDFSDASRAALAQAVRLAPSPAQVTALHVVERSVVDQLGASFEGGIDAATERVIGHTRYGVERMLAEIPASSGAAVGIAVGSVAAELTRAAREEHASLLVLGTVGQTHPGRGVGTSASRVVRHAGRSVLLVRPDASGPFRRIVACVDFSDTSACALREAVDLARRDGAHLTAVHVFTPPPPAYPVTDAMGLWPIPAPDYAALAQTLRADALAALRHAVSAFQGSGVPIEAKILEDTSYARGICEFAAGTHADLVVIGTQGKSGVRYMLLGSTAERVLREVACSVLAVAPDHAAVAPGGDAP